MHAKNSIPRHTRNVHNISGISHGVCVDTSEGIFLVRKSCHGVGFPCHVQKKVCGVQVQSVKFEQKACITAACVAGRSGMRGFECYHLSVVAKCDHEPDEIQLGEKVLKELSESGTHKILSNERVEEVMKIKANASILQKQVVVKFPGDEHERHQRFSVFDGYKRHFAEFRRFTVTYNSTQHTIDCACCRLLQT